MYDKEQVCTFRVELIALCFQPAQVYLLISCLDLLLFYFSLVIGCKTVSHASHSTTGSDKDEQVQRRGFL